MRLLASIAIVLTACGSRGEPKPADQPAARPPPAVDPLRGLALPEVRAGAGVDAVPAGVLIVASTSALVIDGRSVASINAGHVDAAVLAADRITPLVSWAASQPAGAVARVAIDPALPSPLLVQIASSLAPVRVALVVRTPDGVGAIALADAPPSELIEVDPDDARSAGELAAAIGVARRAPADVRLAWAAPKPPPPPEPARANDDTRAMQEEAARFADLLASTDDGNATEGDMSAHRPGADLGQQLDDEADVAIAGRGGTALGAGRGTRGNGDPRIGMVGGDLDAPDKLYMDDEPVTPAGRISFSGGRATDDTSLTVDAVKRKVLSAYLSGLKRCYKHQLKVDPALHGAGSLSFTVTETGRATGPVVRAPDVELAGCFEGVVANWRFAVPRDADGEPTSAAFQLDLQLVPD